MNEPSLLITGRESVETELNSGKWIAGPNGSDVFDRVE